MGKNINKAQFRILGVAIFDSFIQQVPSLKKCYINYRIFPNNCVEFPFKILQYRKDH